MRMLIMGAPGSGKGTQAAFLSQRLGIPAISTGAMLRAAIEEGTQLGQQAEHYINQGKLVPDDVMIALVLSRIAQSDCDDGYLLDGFPRTLAQVRAMEQAGIPVDVVLMIEVSDEDVIKRLGGRRVCRKCGATYHVHYNPPAKQGICDLCDGPLIIRADDTPETIEDRLDIYYESTAPVIEFYKNNGKLVTVKSQEKVEDTSHSVLDALGVAL